MSNISFSVLIHVINGNDLVYFSAGISPECFANISGDAAIRQALAIMVRNPEVDPDQVGYSIGEIAVLDGTEPDIYEIRVEANVSDETAFVEEAKKAYVSNWQDQDWQPESLAEAAYEILVASNPAPAPVDIGFEIMSWRPLADAHSFAAPGCS